MNCVICVTSETRVVDSRWMPPNRVRRRRECPQCLKRFTTFEQIEVSYPKVIKRDKSVVPFDEQKIRHGVLIALEKRPVAHELCETLMSKILAELLQGSGREIATDKIGDCVMKNLLLVDQVAYVRFASVYKSFESLDAFHAFIRELQLNNEVII